MAQDGKFHVKDDKEFKKYIKPVVDKAVEEEIGISGAKRLALAEKKVKSLQKKLNARDKANAGLMKRLMELKSNYDGLMVAYTLLREISVDKPNDCSMEERDHAK